MIERLTLLKGLGQMARDLVTSVKSRGTFVLVSPGERWTLNGQSQSGSMDGVGIAGNVVSPMFRLSKRPVEAGDPSGKLLEQRVWERGERERRIVMIRIGIPTLS